MSDPTGSTKAQRRAWSVRPFLGLVGALAYVASGCGDDTTSPPDDPPAPFFASDWASTYQEVRDCRRSADHDLNYIRILAAGDAVQTYLDRDEPFAEGAVILKPEYADEGCTDLTGFTVMRKGPAGGAPDFGDWEWQKTDADEVVDEKADIARCTACHAGCGVPPGGHDWTCAEP